MTDTSVLFEGDTDCGHYKVIDVIYAGRSARLLYSGNHRAAQSGWALDDNPELLFDYNERFMELIRGLRPERVLLIGGGAFSLPRALQQEFPNLWLDVVELDAGLLALAKKYFDFKPSSRTRIFLEDGAQYLAEARVPAAETYDMILLDVFLHAAVPPAFQTADAAKSLKRLLAPRGVVAQNIIAAYHGERAATLKRQLAAYRAAFADLQLFPAGRRSSLWLPQNFIITAQSAQRDLQPHLRYEGLALPGVHDVSG